MRKPLLLNIILTLVWVALTGDYALANFLLGFVFAFAALRFALGKSGKRYFLFVPRMVGFIGFFVWELIKSNIQVALDVVTPPFYMKPGIVAVPLDAQTDAEISLLANLITLTPGTLSLDVSDDRKVLYVHVMYLDDEQQFVESIKSGFEKRLLNLMR
ncbi:Na+/H+ antiporter subunit E [Leptolyngbya sp. GB1-A1]|uniref:Na+/H+ antiporter subunit E n=1 Tax=Leptolyngbya sp. GB1-A1 TaxID=2933908 RepID=UPI003298614D